MKEVRALSIESPNGLTFSGCTLPAPWSVLASMFPDVAGLAGPLDLCRQMDLVPVPSLLMDCDGIVQITTSEECHALARYFRRVGKQLEKYEADSEEALEFDFDE